MMSLEPKEKIIMQRGLFECRGRVIQRVGGRRRRRRRNSGRKGVVLENILKKSIIYSNS
jgi:hypothetical protein